MQRACLMLRCRMPCSVPCWRHGCCCRAFLTASHMRLAQAGGTRQAQCNVVYFSCLLLLVTDVLSEGVMPPVCGAEPQSVYVDPWYVLMQETHVQCLTGCDVF